MARYDQKEQWINTFKQHVLSPGSKLSVRQKRISSLLISEVLSDEDKNTLDDLLRAEYEVATALKVAGRARHKARRIESEAKKIRVRQAFALADLLVMSGVIDGKTLSFHRGVDKDLLVGHLREVFNKPGEYIAFARQDGAKEIAARIADREQKKADRLAIIQQGKQRRAALRDALA